MVMPAMKMDHLAPLVQWILMLKMQLPLLPLDFNAHASPLPMNLQVHVLLTK
jgi:hypothetical protein